jgi:3'-phosphoadenosine 5'-phosphosulfate sulfotransferase (PAPS reductase)/FAD synthetase
MLTVSWFSAGVSSAVATKLAINEIDRIIYTHIEDQHPDTMRFVKDCEQWFGKEIEVLQSPLKNVETACLSAGGKGYITGRGFSPCTKYLKRDVRKQWEYEQPIDVQLRYVWGMDYGEKSRCEGICLSCPNQQHLFPLVEKKMSKVQAHEVLAASGIKRPVMYELGYHNNNCIMCVRGGMGYFNKNRIDFPEEFAARARLERVIGASCIKGVYLDELDPTAGRHELPIASDCGILCEAIAIGY